MAERVALVTGAARRVGARIVRELHAAGMSVAIHFHRSRRDAETLREELEDARPGTAMTVAADLVEPGGPASVVAAAGERWGRLDVLVNNASTFYPTPVGEATESEWNDLLGSNLAAPFFLAQAATPLLRAVRGSIVNIADVYGHRPLAGHPIYSAAKAGLVMLTRSLALELGPEVRVNSISPGAVLWPENDEPDRRRIIAEIALGRSGDPGDVARAVLFLVRDATYVTGQDLAVDGGRLVSG
ncbi:MAG: pteridine reductase [Immundisolibacterales bacterium]|nr:pteridine reductase [Immundisolibacterales bacterium]